MESPPAALESGRSSPSPAASPEFEFWMVGKNPGSFPSPALLTADELFSDGVVLPLHTVVLQPPPSGPDAGAEADDSSALPEADGEASAQPPLAECCAAPPPDLPAVTFKWKDIFKAGPGGGAEPKDRASKKTERRVSSVSGNSELININIWPFSRSRSAGHSASASANGSAVSKAKANANANANNANVAVIGALAMASSSPTPAGRKVSSAPCSRSNSRGETPGPAAAAVAVSAAAEAAAMAQAAGGPGSMLRRWVPGGHGRAAAAAAGAATGIRLGRASPVWQLRRNKLQQQQAAAEQKQQQQAMAKNKAVPVAAAAGTQDDEEEEEEEEEEEDKAAAAAAAAPSVSAPTAAACRNKASCSEGAGVGAGEECSPPQGLFGLRTFFSKKVY